MKDMLNSPDQSSKGSVQSIFLNIAYIRIAYSHEMLSWVSLRRLRSVSLSARANKLFAPIYTLLGEHAWTGQSVYYTELFRKLQSTRTGAFQLECGQSAHSGTLRRNGMKKNWVFSCL